MATSRRTAFPDRPILGLPAISAIIGLKNKKQSGPAPSLFTDELISEFNAFRVAADGGEHPVAGCDKMAGVKITNEQNGGKLVEEDCVYSLTGVAAQRSRCSAIICPGQRGALGNQAYRFDDHRGKWARK
jgi:hypothetical protein